MIMNLISDQLLDTKIPSEVNLSKCSLQINTMAFSPPCLVEFLARAIFRMRIFFSFCRYVRRVSAARLPLFGKFAYFHFNRRRTRSTEARRMKGTSTQIELFFCNEAGRGENMWKVIKN